MNRMSNRIAAATLALGLAVGGASAALAGHLNNVLEGDLTGRQEVRTDAKNNKNVGDPNGRGEGYVFGIDKDTRGGIDVNNEGTLCYLLIVEKIADLELAPGAPRVAHIHRGAKGENGPVVANLAWPQDGQAADCLSNDEAGKFLNDGTAQEILNNPSGFYFNVHNSEFPGGAIRGQLAYQG